MRLGVLSKVDLLTPNNVIEADLEEHPLSLSRLAQLAEAAGLDKPDVVSGTTSRYQARSTAPCSAGKGRRSDSRRPGNVAFPQPQRAVHLAADPLQFRPAMLSDTDEEARRRAGDEELEDVPWIAIASCLTGCGRRCKLALSPRHGIAVPVTHQECGT
jgi:hypothetical protein